MKKREGEPPTTLQRRNLESEEQLSVPHFSQVTLDDHFKNGRQEKNGLFSKEEACDLAKSYTR